MASWWPKVTKQPQMEHFLKSAGFFLFHLSIWENTFRKPLAQPGQHNQKQTYCNSKIFPCQLAKAQDFLLVRRGVTLGHHPVASQEAHQCLIKFLPKAVGREAKMFWGVFITKESLQCCFFYSSLKVPYCVKFTLPVFCNNLSPAGQGAPQK